MSKFVNEIKYFLPPFLFDFGLYSYGMVKNFLNPHFRDLTKKNVSLKNNGSGKRAFLIATGPSIKEQDLSLLKGEDCFTVSNAFLHENIKDMNPRFHFFAPYHKPLILSNFVSWLKKADKSLPKDTKIFLAVESEAMVKKYNIFKNREIFYLNFGHSFSRKNVDITKVVMAPQSIPLMVLPVLIYMGYSEIYLIGCDHTVLRDYNKRIIHFYGSKKDVRKNSSDSHAWAGIIDAHQTSMSVFNQYTFYKNLINTMLIKIRIINLSPDSWIDSFEFKEYGTLLKKK